MSIVRNQPTELTDETIQQLSDIARMPLDPQDLRRLIAIGWAVRDPNGDERSIKQRKISRQLDAVAKAARSLSEALDALDPPAQKAFAIFAAAGELFGFNKRDQERRFQINDVATFGIDAASKIYVYKKFADSTAQAASSWEAAWWKRGKGPPSKGIDIDSPGNPDVTPLDIFVDACLNVTRGSLTLNKNELSGTLIDFLRAIEPYLPPDLIPKALSGSSLQRIKTNWTANRRKLSDLSS